MTLQKFNLPVEIIDLIATLEPENQGIVYSHLFAYVYHGVAVPDSVDPRCRLILRMIIDKIDARVRRARKSAGRRGQRPEPDTSPARPESVTDEVGQRIIDNVAKSHGSLGAMGQALYEARLRQLQNSGPNKMSSGGSRKGCMT